MQKIAVYNNNLVFERFLLSDRLEHLKDDAELEEFLKVNYNARLKYRKLPYGGNLMYGIIFESEADFLAFKIKFG